MMVESYQPAVHYSWQSDAHDMARATRTLDDGTEQMRMECKCGKTSRWAETYATLHRAVERHAVEVSR